MPVLYANRASSTLASGITNVATSLSVAAGQGARFPAITAPDYFYATLDDNAGNVEVVRVTGRSGDTFTITRAQDGTSALAFSAGAAVELRIVRALLDDFKADTRTGYAPLTGTGASGTWGISISGNAATATSATTASSANSVAWTNVSGRPTAVSSFSNDAGYITNTGNISTSGVFIENGQTVSANYTITSGRNAMSAGPITVASGVTVTVPSGSSWVIV